MRSSRRGAGVSPLGIGAMLACSPAPRRIIDRARTLDGSWPRARRTRRGKFRRSSPRSPAAPADQPRHHALHHHALLVCAVIATCSWRLRAFDTSVPVPVFVAAMVAFFVGLLFFLREIFICDANLRIGPH